MFVLVAPWWAFVLRGVLAILFALFTWLVPGMALLTFVLVFGAFALASGIAIVIAAMRAPASSTETGARPRWALALQGAVGVLVGVLALVSPGITAVALLYLIATWAVVTGALEIAAAIRLRHEPEGSGGEWMLALGGALAVVFGATLFLFPGAGALALVLWIGAYALVYGALLVAVGLDLRSHRGGTRRGRGPGSPIPHAS